MSLTSHASLPSHEPPSAYLKAMADIEQRAFRGELTLAQLRHEIHTLRAHLAIEPMAVARWAVPGC